MRMLGRFWMRAASWSGGKLGMLDKSKPSGMPGGMLFPLVVFCEELAGAAWMLVCGADI